MPKVFWTDKLSFPMFIVANANNILAWIIGNSRKTAAMTERVKQGYDGLFSDHVRRYDELGLKFQMKAAQAQLEEVEIAGARVLDIGCGTGEGIGDRASLTPAQLNVVLTLFPSSDSMTVFSVSTSTLTRRKNAWGG